MHIQRPDYRRSLSAVVIERQELETRIVLRPQITLYLILIAKCLQMSTGHQEFLRLLLHAVLPKQVAEDLEVTGLIHTHILRHLAKIGKSAPLALLVSHDRTIVSDRVLIVLRELHQAIVVVVSTRLPLIPVESSRSSLHMILRPIIPGPVATYRSPAIEPRRIVTFHGLHPGVAVGHPVAGRLITRSHHHKRGVMAVGVHNAPRLLQQILVYLLPLAEFHPVIRPCWPLGLQIDTHLVGSGKSGLRRTVGMEAHVVQSILLHLRKDRDP